MKRLVCLILLLVPALSLSAAITIRIEASFGARKKDCQGGLGICSAKSSEAQMPGRQITLSLSADHTRLTLTVDRLLLDEQEGQLAGDRFIQEEDFPLSREISDALGSAPIAIPAGSYKATYRSGKAEVEFPITEARTGIR